MHHLDLNNSEDRLSLWPFIFMTTRVVAYKMLNNTIKSLIVLYVTC